MAQAEATTLHLKFKSHDCHLLVGGPSSTVWLSTEADSAFVTTTYERSYGKIKTFDGNPDRQVTDEIKLAVAVKPLSGVSPGSYQIPAMLNYQAIDAAGNTVQQRTPVVIPVKVEPIIAHSGSSSQSHPWKTVGTYIGVIALFPLWVLSGIVQLILTGEASSC